MTTMTEERPVCRLCDEPIYRYCHSQAGSLKAYVWTDVDPDGEDDPRYGTRCQYSGTLDAFRHHPEWDVPEPVEDEEW
jgi:hypothetical protein